MKEDTLVVPIRQNMTQTISTRTRFPQTKCPRCSFSPPVAVCRVNVLLLLLAQFFLSFLEKYIFWIISFVLRWIEYNNKLITSKT